MKWNFITNCFLFPSYFITSSLPDHSLRWVKQIAIRLLKQSRVKKMPTKLGRRHPGTFGASFMPTGRFFLHVAAEPSDIRSQWLTNVVIIARFRYWMNGVWNFFGFCSCIGYFLAFYFSSVHWTWSVIHI